MKNKGLSNPVVVAAVASKAADQANATRKSIGKFFQRNGKVMLGTVTGLVVTYVAYKEIKKYRKRVYIEKNLGNYNLIAAMVMYKSMHRISKPVFPFNLLISSIPDGTDEAALFNIATKVTNIQEVAKAYRIVFDVSLADDINSELTNSEMVRFYNTIINKSTYTGSTTAIYPNGTPIYVLNPNGLTVYDVKGNYLAHKDFGEHIGWVEYHFPTQKMYKIDRKGVVDTVMGPGYVMKKDVTNVNPKK